MSIICLVLMYLYIYMNINFLKILNQSPRVYIGILGLFLLVFNMLLMKKIKIDKSYILLGAVSIILMGYWEIGGGINNISETSPFKNYFFKQFINLMSSYCIYKVYKYFYKEKFYFKLLLSIIKVIILDNLLALIRYFIPSLNEKIAMLQVSGSDFSIIGDLAMSKTRLVGVGAVFFQAGIINSMGLLVIAYLIFFLKKKRKELMVCYFLISMIGIFSSRTTIVGVIVSLVYYSILNSRKITDLIKKIIYINLLVMSVIVPITVLLVKSSNLFRNLYINFFIKQGERSLKGLEKMWKVFPKENKTLIFGDFRWQEYSQGKVVGYYMHTDVGYLRVIWAIGVIGLGIVVLYNFYLWVKIRKRLLKPEKLLITMFFIMQIIFNFKGFTNTFQLVYLFLIIYGNNQCKNRFIAN